MSDKAPKRKRIFSGMQPSGEAHLGNYLGALKRWVDLQDEYECIFCIVDDHAITAGGDPSELPRRTFDLAVSFLAVGLDPERSTIFVQSDVPEHTELAWLFNAVTPIGDLARKWNAAYREDFFPEPEPLSGTAGRILGLDGEAKMSKSMGNTVPILAEPDEIWERVRTAVTDPQRVRRDDPGRPVVCNVFTLL